jgi:aspartyl protease family protein
MSKQILAVFIGLACAGIVGKARSDGRQETGGPPSVERSADANGHAIPIETRVRRSPNGHFYVTALVNGQPVRFLVDTGATTVALTTEDARRAGIAFDPGRFDVIGQGASGPVRGQEMHFSSVELDGKERLHVSGVVIEGGNTSLLGQSYLSRLGNVQMRGDEMLLR